MEWFLSDLLYKRAKVGTKANSRPPGRRLGLEVLETRLLFAVDLLWVNTVAATNQWSVAANWADMATGANKAPAAGDNLIFDASKTTAGMAKPGTATDSTDNLAVTFAGLTVAAGFANKFTLNSNLTVSGAADIEGGTFFSTAVMPQVQLQGSGSIVSNVVFDTVGLEFGGDGVLGISQATIQGNLTFQGWHSDLVIAGFVKWTGGDISLSATSHLMDFGNFSIQGGGKIAGHVSDDTQGPQIYVARTFEKDGGNTTLISNSTFEMDQANASFELKAGTVQFTSTDVTQNAGVTEMSGGNLTTDGYIDIEGGTLRGYGTIDGSLKNVGGTVHPGLTVPGKLYVTGFYQQSAGGTLAIDAISDQAPNGYGVLKVQSFVLLDGNLAVKRDPAFQPPDGTLLPFLTWGNYPDGTTGPPGDFAKINITNQKWSINGTSFSIVGDRDVPHYVYNLEVKGTVDVSGCAFNDANGNHRQDAGEAGLPNVAVTLAGSDGTSFTTQTASDGSYEFDNLTLGVAYTVSTSTPPNDTLEGYYADDGTPNSTASFTPTSAQPTGNIDAAFATASTTTTLSSSNLSPSVGQAVTFTASVSPTGGGMGFPSGTVSFFDGSTLLGSVTLSASSQASFTTSSLSVGSHTISAVYGGDSTYGGSSASLTEAVQSGGAGTLDSVMLAESAQSGLPGQAVTFTATVMTGGTSAPTNAPTGTVSFYDNGIFLATISLSQGTGGAQAAYSTSSLAMGSHTITATYNGDANDAPCSTWVTYTVVPPA